LINQLVKKFSVILKSKTFKTAGIFTGGNLISAGIMGISAIFVARWISPNTMGEISKYAILTSYLGFGLIPVHAAFQRHYLFYLGKGEKETALNIASQAKWWYSFFNWSASGVIVLLIIKSFLTSDLRAAVGWGVQIPAIWMLIFGAYLQVLYRSSGDFRRLTQIKLMSTGIATVALVFVRFFGYWGLAFKLFVNNLALFFYHTFYAPVRIKSRFNLKGLLNLAKVSVPLQIPSYIDTYLLGGTIKYFILTKIDQKSLGIYVMAIGIQGTLMIFSSSISQIFNTKISLKYGATENIFKSLKYAILPTLLVFIFTISMALIFSISIGPLMYAYTPKYILAIPVILVLVWELPLSVLKYPLVLFTSALWYKASIALRIFKAIFCFLLILILGKNLLSIAWIIILSDVIFIVASYSVFIFVRLSSKQNKIN